MRFAHSAIFLDISGVTIQSLPPIVFGSSALGNLFEVVPDETKLAIVRNWLKEQPNPVIDSAGKYGAGLALEMIGEKLAQLGIAPEAVTISNKLGWKRKPLTTPEPTFEKGAWFGLKHDAEAAISYDGILDCWEQGNALLGDYNADLLSVHDPDEYLAAAKSDDEADARYADVRGAYRALCELRDSGQATGVGVGSKDWRVIRRLHQDGVDLDWVMIANSYTIYDHPKGVEELIAALHADGIVVVNSAVFNAGFLIGGRFFDYCEITPETHPQQFAWRDAFLALCKTHNVSAPHACCQFGIRPEGVAALALNSSNPKRVAENVRFVTETIPDDFWTALQDAGLTS